MELEPQDVASLTGALNSAVSAINRFHAPSSSNAANINVNGGSWIGTGLMCLMAVCTCVTATLYFSDRETLKEEKSQLQQQNRSDVVRMEAEIKDLRDNQTTLQAYVNQLYRNQKK